MLRPLPDRITMKLRPKELELAAAPPAADISAASDDGSAAAGDGEAPVPEQPVEPDGTGRKIEAGV